MKSILWRFSCRYGAFRAPSKATAALWLVVWLGFTHLAAVSVAVAQSEPPLRITALGDSLTAGYGLAPGDGLVPQLQAWLDARGHRVSLHNAGVSGDTTSGGLARLDWTLADRPGAMIVALGGNDLLRGIDPALSRANLAAILTRLRDEGIPALLVGLPAPANYGPDFQTLFAALYTDLAAEFDTLLVADMLAPLARELAAGRPASALMQPDMIHPDTAGVALVVEHIGPAVVALIERANAAEGG